MSNKFRYFCAVSATVLCCTFAGAEDRLCGVFPEDIKCVAVISPASSPNRKSIDRGIAMLKKAGIKVKTGTHLYSADNKKIPLEERLADWNAAVSDPEVDMIIPTRGGAFSHELLAHIDWKQVKERNIKLIGFSNITCLTSGMKARNSGYPIAGPNLGRMTRLPKKAAQHLKCVLARKSPPAVKLVPLRGGDVSGKVQAGHISLLDLNFNSPFAFKPDNRIVFVECVGKDTKSLTKTFDNLLKKGYFDKVSGVVLCHFTRVKDAENLPGMFKDWTSRLKCPVYCGYPYGHENDNRAIDLQSTAVIKDNILTFVWE